jgi:hypothetical protein
MACIEADNAGSVVRRKALVLGLTQEDRDRLASGEPIVLEGSHSALLQLQAAGVNVIVLKGDTVEEMVDKLGDMLGESPTHVIDHRDGRAN